MKKFKQIFLSLVLAVFSFAFVACSMPKAYTITFVNYDDSVLLELILEEGFTPEYTLAEPTRESTEQYSYTFVGWDKVIAPATEDITYKAMFTQTVNKYLVSFVNDDGTVLQSQELEYGQMPSYEGETPAKQNTPQTTYTFTGWDKEIVEVTGEATYTATYKEETVKYKACFYDLDGNVLYEVELLYGEVPVYQGETPALEGDAQYSYEFTGWTTELAPITKDTNYRPKFNRVVNKYLIKFVDEEGEILQESQVPYGEIPVFEGVLPLPEDTAQYDYTGAWDKEFAEVTGEATYKYIVTGAVRTYQVKFANDDGKVLAMGKYEYGAMPQFDKTPYKAASAEYLYTFAGWDAEIAKVTSDVTYTAKYTQVANTYDVVVGHATVDGAVAGAPATQNLTENKLYTYNAPSIDGLTASHEYVKFNYNGQKVLLTIYYSEMDEWDGESISTAFEGEGTQENPYLIKSGADFALLRANVNAGNAYGNTYFKMTKSVDLNNYNLVIGASEDVSFAGIFDGNNCAIKNIATSETKTGGYVGFFQSILTGGKLSNLSTYGEYTQAVKGNAVVVGANYGTIENVTNYASIVIADDVTPAELHRYTAGIVSWNYATITSCVNYGNIAGEEYPSGIAARQEGADAKIENCINFGTISGSGFRTAGIVGYAVKGTVIGCINYGSVSTGATSNTIEMGGIAGLSGANISNCINYGELTVKVNKEKVGGIVGSATGGSVTNCINYGTVNGYNYVAGIAGYATIALSDNTNNGVINANQWVGGIVGRCNKDITNCTNNGNVTGKIDFVGGIVGASDGSAGRTVSGCVNNGDIYGSNYVGGIDGRPYAGNMLVENCINNGTVQAKGNFAGGILGRANTADSVITLKGCESYGNVTSKYPGAFIAVIASEESYVMEGCTTNLKNIYEIGYNSATKLPHGNIQKTFKVTFMDEKGNVLQSGEVDEGTMPVFNGTLPTVPENTDYCTYTGAWDKEIVAVTGEVTYTYKITATYAKYTVKFLNEDNSLLYEVQVEWGQTAVYQGEEPTKTSTADKVYQFVGWNAELAPITGDTVYTAVFEERANKYVIKFVDQEGTVLQEGEIEYGAMPVFEGVLPLPEDTAQYDYTGAWDKEIVPVEGEATYTYIVTSVVKSYEVKFVNDNGTVLEAAKYEYGTMPQMDKVPYKAATVENIYTFAGWDKEIAEVVADVTYTATYTQVANTYEVVVGHVTIDGYVASAPAMQNLTENKLYTYNAPVVEGLTASHEYVKYNFAGEKVLLTVYYSQMDLWDGQSVSTALEGEGTEENPYLINSGADLALLRAFVNGGNTYANTYFKMTKSIDLNSVSLMVGNSATNSFAGFFDGNNCAIKNIATKETATGQYAGLFKILLAGGKISNLSTYGEYTQTIKMNGVIVGQNYGTIENVTNYVSIVIADGVKPGDKHRYTAGIASINYNTMVSCVNYGTIYGEQYASGITSKQMENANKIENCINYGNIIGSGFRCGGIVGYAVGGEVTGCINYAESVRGSQYLGGIVGHTQSAVIKNCINYSYLNRTGNNQTGGITGWSDSEISGCINYGTVPGNEYAGGIVGYTKYAVVDCQNFGQVTGKQWVGGIVGTCFGNITNCTNNGDVTGTADFVGGIVGTSGNNDNKTITTRTISGCVNNGAVSAVNYVGGIDGRPYIGNVTYLNCTNNGKITATSYAGGIVGRTNGVFATLIGCVSDGEVVAKGYADENGEIIGKYPGIYVGYNTTSDTTGYVIYDSCSTKLTGNAIGYDSTLGAGVALEGFVYTPTAQE